MNAVLRYIIQYHNFFFVAPSERKTLKIMTNKRNAPTNGLEKWQHADGQTNNLDKQTNISFFVS